MVDGNRSSAFRGGNRFRRGQAAPAWIVPTDRLVPIGLIFLGSIRGELLY
jgi:hypothetical protein